MLVFLQLFFAIFTAAALLYSFRKSSGDLFYSVAFFQVTFIAAYIGLPSFIGSIQTLGGSGTEQEYFGELVAVQIQFLFVASYLAGYFWSAKLKPLGLISSMPQNVSSFGAKPKAAILFAILLLGLASLFDRFDLAYGELQSAVISGSTDPMANITGFFSRFFPAALAILLIDSWKSRKTTSLVCYLALSILLASAALLSGTRAPIVHYLALVSLAVWVAIDSTRGFRFLINAVAALLFISPILLELRSGILLSNESTQVKLSAITESIINVKPNLGESVGTVTERADIVHNTIGLYDYLQGTRDYSQFQPYLGVILSPVPRVLWQEKPYARSSDGSVDGIPSFRLAYILYGNPNLSITTHGAIDMFWQFGWVGVTLGAFLTGSLLGWIFLSLSNTGKWGLGLGLYLAELLVFGGGVSLDTLLFFVIQSFLPILLLIFLFKLLPFETNLTHKH